MSETENTAAAAAADNPSEAVPAVAPVSERVVVKERSGGKGLAVAALLFAMTGLGASGFLFVQGQNVLARQQLVFDQKIREAALGESENGVMLAEAVRKADESSRYMTDLQAALVRQQADIEQANRTVQALLKRRSDWVVDETEAALNVALQQLVLTDNLPAAVAVLESIDARLARFDQPQLLPLKQALAGDLAALKQMPFLDLSGNALRLSRLETGAASLPLLLDNSLRPPQAAPQTVDEGGNLWQNAWRRSLAGLKGMVEIRRIGHTDAMLMSAEQAFYVRENLRLRLLSARIALMQHQGEVYRQDLSAAEAAVRQYFDPASAAVQAWLREIEALKTLNLEGGKLNQALAGSLKAVEDYRRQRDADVLAAVSPETAADVSAASDAAPAAAVPSVVGETVTGQSAVPAQTSEPARPASAAEQGVRS